MRSIHFVAAIGLAIAPLTVKASSGGSWAALDSAAHVACKAQIRMIASTARVSATTGRVLGIGGDGDLYYALTFRGKEGGASARWLCLYDKHAKKAQARELTQ